MEKAAFGGRGTARAEDAQGTPAQSHVSPSILVYEDCALYKLTHGQTQVLVEMERAAQIIDRNAAAPCTGVPRS